MQNALESPPSASSGRRQPVTVVATVYNSAASLRRFVEEALASFDIQESKLECVEFVLVNDGSTDDSLDVLRQFRKEDRRIRVVNLSRNFGHHAAIVAGLSVTPESTLVFLIDSDLEEDPSWVHSFFSIMSDTHADVVFGVQKRRTGSGGVIGRSAGRAFWRLLQRMVDYPLHANQVTCRLMSRRFVEAALETTDRVVMLGELWAWVGFKQVPQEVEKRLTDGRSKTAYSLRKRLKLAVNAMSSTSAAPLASVFATGTAVAALSLLVAVATFVWRLRNGITEGTGFATLLISVWFLGGLTLAAVGLVGLYLSRLFDQMRRRPVFVIADME